MQVYDRVLPSANDATLIALSSIVIVLIIVGAMVDGVRSAMLVRLANQLDMSWRGRILHACLNNGTGSGGSRDLEVIRSFITGSTAMAILDMPWSLVYLTAIVLLNLWLGVFTLLSCALVILIAICGERAAQRYVKEGQVASSGVHRVLDASVTNLDALRAMGGLASVQGDITKRSLRAVALQSAGLDRHLWAGAAGRGLRSVAQVLLVAIAANLAVNNRVPAGVIVASSMLFMRTLAPIERVAFGWRSAVAALASLTRLRDLTSRCDPAEHRVTMPPLSGRLEVAGLTGGFQSQRPTVSEVDFALEPGEILAVVGRSGAGKSTLARLLVGALRPTAGAVRLDGACIADLAPAEIGSQIGYLPQDLQLFDDTVATAIARSQKIDDRQVVAAAQLAGAHDMILRLPRGYQTRVGPGGCQLAFGERQRICLARAVYGNPSLIVLDEPTAHLDDGGEKLFLHMLESVAQAGSAVVVVTKSASVMRAATAFLMLERGQVKLFKRESGLQLACAQTNAQLRAGMTEQLRVRE